MTSDLVEKLTHGKNTDGLVTLKKTIIIDHFSVGTFTIDAENFHKPCTIYCRNQMVFDLLFTKS